MARLTKRAQVARAAAGRKGCVGAQRSRRNARTAQDTAECAERPRNATALSAADYFPRFRLSMALSKAASEKPSEYALGTTTVPPDPFTDS